MKTVCFICYVFECLNTDFVGNINTINAYNAVKMALARCTGYNII
jgi:hypothetical protein